MTPSNEIRLFGLEISVWLYAPALLVLWLAIFYILKAVLFRRFGRWIEKNTPPGHDFTAESLHLPLNVIILSGGLAFFEKLLPLPEDLDRAVLTLIKILVILAGLLFADRLMIEALRYFSTRVRAFDLSRGIVRGSARMVILSLGLMILLDALGISITPLVASLGIGSLAVALGLQETLVNFFAGVYILADRPIRAGDFIRLDSGEEGYVADIGWRNTRIQMPPDVVVVVPNNKIISGTIHNYNLPDKEISVPVQTGVHYASDLAKVESITLAVARETQKRVSGAVAAFEPSFRYHTFADSSINFTVVLRAKEFSEQHLLKHEFIKALHRRYQEEGIVIPFPTRTLDIPAHVPAVPGIRGASAGPQGTAAE